MSANAHMDDVSVAGAATARAAAFLLLAAIADAAVLAAAYRAALPLPAALVAHGLIAASCWLFRDPRRDRSAAILAMLSMLAMGPLGALGSLALLGYLRRARPGDASLQGWYRVLSFAGEADPAGTVHDAITEGRAFLPNAARLCDFATVMASGSIAQRQALLGTISQRFHPDYLPILQAALKSPDAAVRVSAAAVFAKLREGNRKRFKRAGGADTTGDAPLGRARALASCARAGFLDADEAARARSEAVELLLLLRPTVTEIDATEELLCGLLLDAGRHGEIRERYGAAGNSALSPSLRDLLARALMRSQRYFEVHRIVNADTGRRAPVSAPPPPPPLLEPHHQEA